MKKVVVLLLVLISFSLHGLVIWEEVDDKEFIELLTSFPSPEEIIDIEVNYYPDDLSPQKFLTDRSLKKIAELCPDLRSFQTNGNKLTDEGIQKLAALCPKLEVLDLSATCNCKGDVTDAGVTKLSQVCPLLQEIYLTGHNQITDKGVLAIAFNCHQLKVLDVSGNGKKVQGKITNYGLYALAKYSAGLKILDVSQNSGVTFDGAKALIIYCQQLEELNIDNTSITKEEYKKLCKIKPDVSILWDK